LRPNPHCRVPHERNLWQWHIEVRRVPAVLAEEVALWPTLLHVRDGEMQSVLRKVLRVATIALGLRRDRS
jgi:hypothetical protein